MICPQCESEYRAGFDQCAFCRVPLVEHLDTAALASDTVDSTVAVFESDDPAQIAVAKSMLSSAGIQYATRGEDGFGAVRLAQVPPEHDRLLVSVELSVLATDVEEATSLLNGLGEAGSNDGVALEGPDDAGPEQPHWQPAMPGIDSAARKQRVRLGRAVTDVSTSPSVVLILVVGSVLSLVSRTPDQDGWLGFVVSLPFGFLLTGYSLTYTRQVAISGDGRLCAIAGLAAIARRGVVGTALVVLPFAALAGLAAAIGVGSDFLAAYQGGSIDGLVSFLLIALQLIGGVFGLAGLVMMPAIPTAVSARYAFHDDAREGLRYIAALKKAWLFRRAASVPIVFTIVSYTLLLTLTYGVDSLLDTRVMSSFAQAVSSVLRGDATGLHVVILATVAVITALWTSITLIEANLVGRYAEIAYAPYSDSGMDGLTMASTPTNRGHEVV